ncbi:hypothetical protein AWC38_SpisGene1614 [Stylophora pistillata]|uniref:Uncharacterized protein n=1 Tax=Stylophora pistillata TaxID=50429 RepID=A0A2B4SYI2_STYPI|nr:hypothetical protein AWC38_SpisGene1614 [Stylophora pistillata]
MLKQTEAGRTTRKKYKLAKEKKRNSADSRNKTRFSRTKVATNERETFRYETENTTIEGDDLGICIYPEEKCINEIQGQGELEVAKSDFQKLKVFDKESSDDSLSMISLNSRPTSAVTDFAEEVNLEGYEEFSSLENLNVTDQIQMRKISTGSNSSDLEILVDEGSPRIQGIEILEENNLVDEQTEKDNSGNAKATLLVGEVEIIDENENKKANVKPAWELSKKFLLTADFPARIWKEDMNGKAMNARRKSSELLNASFPPLSTVPELRRGSFPNSSLMSSDSSRELPMLSGRHCKVKLPTHFPGVPSPHVESDSESKSSDDEVSNVLLLEKGQKARGNSAKLHKNQLDIPGKQGNNLTISSTKSSPILSRSHSPMASTENLAMRVASTEYLATRVVTQLDCALQETVNVSKDRETIRVGCVTPNLMPRRVKSDMD